MYVELLFSCAGADSRRNFISSTTTCRCQCREIVSDNFGRPQRAYPSLHALKCYRQSYSMRERTRGVWIQECVGSSPAPYRKPTSCLGNTIPCLVICPRIECRAGPKFGNTYVVPYDSPFRNYQLPISVNTLNVLEIVCTISAGNAGRQPLCDSGSNSFGRNENCEERGKQC